MYPVFLRELPDNFCDKLFGLSVAGPVTQAVGKIELKEDKETV